DHEIARHGGAFRPTHLLTGTVRNTPYGDRRPRSIQSWEVDLHSGPGSCLRCESRSRGCQHLSAHLRRIRTAEFCVENELGLSARFLPEPANKSDTVCVDRT